MFTLSISLLARGVVRLPRQGHRRARDLVTPRWGGSIRPNAECEGGCGERGYFVRKGHRDEIGVSGIVRDNEARRAGGE